MDAIRDFKLLDNLVGYDKTKNPKSLSVYELLPYGIEWLYNGKINEIKCNEKLVPLLLRDNSGIALIKSPFNKKDNQAYIVSPLNEIQWNVGELVRNNIGDALFFDVYYVFNDLCFFINLSGRDYRFVFEPETGKVGNLILSF